MEKLEGGLETTLLRDADFKEVLELARLLIEAQP